MTRLEELEKVLQIHDWYYEYSDDHRVWCKGRDQNNAIMSLRKELEKAGLKEQADLLYKKYRPSKL